jgi:hypothetical protein
MKLPFGKRDCRDCGYFLVQEMTGISVCNFHQMSLPGFQQRDKNGLYVAVYPACDDFYKKDSLNYDFFDFCD